MSYYVVTEAITPPNSGTGALAAGSDADEAGPKTPNNASGPPAETPDQATPEKNQR